MDAKERARKVAEELGRLVAYTASIKFAQTQKLCAERCAEKFTPLLAAAIEQAVLEEAEWWTKVDANDSEWRYMATQRLAALRAKAGERSGREELHDSSTKD